MTDQYPYGQLDQWKDSVQADREQAWRLAARIEQRGRTAEEVATRQAYLDLFGLRPGQRVLEVGCGSGVVLRELARRVGPRGQVVGLDASAHLLAIARELTEEESLLDCVELRQGDARELPFGDDEFDAALAVTALSHIPRGADAVPELVRVVRPGGRVGIFDRDTDSVIVSHPNRTLTRRIVATYSDNAQVDGWLARRLPGLLAECGVREIRIQGFVALDRDPAGYYANVAERMAQIALETGAVTPEEARRWLEQLQAEQAAGRFLCGIVQLFVWGLR